MDHDSTPLTEADLRLCLRRLQAKTDELFIPEDEEEIDALFLLTGMQKEDI